LNLTKRLYDGVKVLRHENVLVLNASHGLLLYPLMKMNPEGYSVAQVRTTEQKGIIDHFSSELEEILRPEILVGTPMESLLGLEEGLLFSVISGRNVLSRLSQDKDILSVMKDRLEKDGCITLLESIPSLSSRLSDFVDGDTKEKLLLSEGRVYCASNSLTNWGKTELEETLKEVFPEVSVEYEEFSEKRLVLPEAAEHWFENSYQDSGLTKGEFMEAFAGKTFLWRNTVAIVKTNRDFHRIETSPEWAEVHKRVHGEA
ncbi:MAG: hypothetical protein KBS81_12015, partial [Spirochaetales bacterium]|nr:hypothetical protein [Candidatus Physcosoma equi]